MHTGSIMVHDYIFLEENLAVYIRIKNFYSL